uniref:RLR CTR domain-containing protein n=1 Tax=Strongyloides stercoralis TaxID=6248 RepID=A0A0K0E192_STRER
MNYYTVPIKPRLRLWEREIKLTIIYPHLERILSIASTLDYDNNWSLEGRGEINKIEIGNEFFEKFALVKSGIFLEIATSIISDFPWSDFLMNKIPLKKHINFIKIISSSKHPLIDYVLINILPTKKVIDKLIEKNVAFTEISCKVNSIINHDKHNYIYANCVLIRNLPFVTTYNGDFDEWLQYFLQTLDEFPETKFILKYLDVEFKDYINHTEIEEMDKEMVVDRMNFENNLIVNPKHPGVFRSQNKFNSNRMDIRSVLESIKVDLRNYQKECITPAINGESCMLILPTKTGTKICISEIIRNHILLSRNKNQPYRVCLIVSSLKSLNEATISLRQYFKNFISIFSGCLNDFSKHTVDRLLKNDVIIVTPTFLQRCLNSLLMEQKIFYNDFTLLIIEDIQNHRNKITSKYLFDDLFMGEVNVNQIVGVYKNISKNYSYHIDDVLYSFYETCAETRLTKISIPTIYYDEMIRHFQNSYDALYPFDLPDSYSKGLIEMKVSRLLMKLQFLKDNGYTFNEIDDSLLPNISTYEFMLDLIKIDFELQLSKQDYKIQEMIVVINCLKEYFHAILISSILPTAYFTEFLRERYDVLKKHIGHLNCFDENFSDFTIIINEIEELHFRQDVQPPLQLLGKVVNILKEEILIKHSHHVVVFAPTNYIVKSVKKYFYDIFLNHDIHVASLSNVEASNEVLKNNIFNEFQKERMSILVTTHIVEWNYNLPKRDLDININDCLYDMNLCLSGPEKIEKKNKKYLFYYPSYITPACEVNIQRQKTLHQFCEAISKTSPNSVRKKIENLIKKLNLESSCIKSYQKERECTLRENIFKIKCKRCDKYLGSSKSIKKYMDYYIIIDGSFFKKVYIKLYDNITNDFEIFCIGQVVCSVCCNGKSDLCLKNITIGNLISHGSTYFCSLKSSNIILENEKGERFNKNSWHDIEKRLIYVEEIKEIELLGYKNEFIKTNPDLVEDLSMLVVNDMNSKIVRSKIVHLSECLEIFR